MWLILGIMLFTISHIWILYKLNKWRPYEYNTMFCRDVRAQEGMFAYVSDLEETRKHLNRKNSKFWGGKMIVVISAIIIFILLCLSAILAFIVPLKQHNTEIENKYKTDSVLLTIVQHSKNVPVIIDVIA